MGEKLVIYNEEIGKYDFVDVFAGIGGFSLGLERIDEIETKVFCEQDKHALEILDKHWPLVRKVNDIRKLVLNRQYFGIAGGFPCQDISLAGGRKGIDNGERSSLWKEMLRIIDEVGPNYAIIENVEYLRKNGLGIVLNDLARIGYDAEWACITAASVGYPHQRKRLFIIAYPSRQRLNEYFRGERQLPIDEKRTCAQIYGKRQKCEPEFISVREVLSKRTFEKYASTSTDKHAIVSKLHRVTNGLPDRLDEKNRKQRIKQLGNSIVPDIAEIIGRAIIEREKQ